MLKERLAEADPKPGLAGKVAARLALIAVIGFLWVFPTFSLVFLIEREPIEITVTSCGDDRRSSGGSCKGTWTLADGSIGNGEFTSYREEHEEGDVLDGVYIGGRAALSPLPWILDVALMYPLAIGLSVRMVVAAVRRRRGSGAPEEPKVPGRAASFFGYVAIVGVLGFLWGFPTYSAFAVATAEPVAITVSDCGGSRCHGEWIGPDGKPGNGSIEVERQYEDGEVIEGMSIGDRTVRFPHTWVLDMAWLYPIAAVVTIGYVLLWRKVRKARRESEQSYSSSK